MLKKYLTKKVFIILGIVAVTIAVSITLLVINGKEKTPSIPKLYLPKVTALKLKSGLDQEFTVTGEVFAYKVNSITADQKSKVESILVKEGDVVTKNQKLITLSSSTISSTLNTAGSTLQNARLNLEGTKLSSDKSIQASEITLSTAKSNLNNVLSQNKTLKKQAEETLKSSTITANLGSSTAKTTLDNAVANSYPVTQTAFNAANQILGISGIHKYTNTDFRKYLGAAKVNSKKDAENELKKVEVLMLSYSKTYNNALGLFTSIEAALQKLLIALSNSAYGADYAQSEISADITSINTQLGYVQNALSTLKSANAALDSAEKNANGNSQTIIDAKAAYGATIAKLSANEDSAKRSVESAQNALESAKRSAQLSQLSAKTSVDSAYGTYDQASINRNKLEVKANFNGKVSEIHVKTGEEVSSGGKLITIQDDSKLKLVAYLSSDDVKKLKVGDKVIINKNGESSTISSIAPSADSITKKYKVEIEHVSLSLRPGELIQLTFKLGAKITNGGKLYVPLTSLHILPDDIFVWSLKDGKTVKIKVTTGEISGDYVEITNGLKIGDQIIGSGGRLIEEEGVKVEIINK